MLQMHTDPESMPARPIFNPIPQAKSRISAVDIPGLELLCVLLALLQLLPLLLLLLTVALIVA